MWSSWSLSNFLNSKHSSEQEFESVSYASGKCHYKGCTCRLLPIFLVFCQIAMRKSKEVTKNLSPKPLIGRFTPRGYHGTSMLWIGKKHLKLVVLSHRKAMCYRLDELLYAISVFLWFYYFFFFSNESFIPTPGWKCFQKILLMGKADLHVGLHGSFLQPNLIDCKA